MLPVCQKHLSRCLAKPQSISPTITNCVSKWLSSIQKRQSEIVFWGGRLVIEHTSKQRWTCAGFKSFNPLLEISTAFADGGGGWLLLHALLRKESLGKAENVHHGTAFESVCTSSCPCLQPPLLLKNLEILHNHIQRQREGGSEGGRDGGTEGRRKGGREWERDGKGNTAGRKVHTKE